MSSSSEISIGMNCACGCEVKLFTLRTQDNPGRPFLRCVSECKSKGQRHTFKWVEDYLMEELGMVKSEMEELKKSSEESKMIIQKMQKTEFIGQIGVSVLFMAIGVGIGYWFVSSK